jgi:TRAP-type uncharacterized transport system substrate-binding protein
VTAALASGRVRLLPLDATLLERLADQYPYYSVARIDAGTYPSQQAGIATIAMLNWIVARHDFDAEVVRFVLDMLNAEQDLLREAVQLSGEINLTNLFAAPIQLHDAVRRWLADAPQVPADDEAGS